MTTYYSIAGSPHRDAVLLLDGAADLSLDLLGGLLAAGLGHGQAVQPITGQY